MSDRKTSEQAKRAIIKAAEYIRRCGWQTSGMAVAKQMSDKLYRELKASMLA